jgi:hypothetical protein
MLHRGLWDGSDATNIEIFALALASCATLCTNQSPCRQDEEEREGQK